MFRFAIAVLATVLLQGCAVSPPASGLPPLVHAIVMGDVAEAERLLQGGQDPNEADQHGLSYVHRTALLSSGHQHGAALMQKMLQYGGNPNLQLPPNQLAPLHVANNAEVAQVLLAAGADVNARSLAGTTPLHAVGSAAHARVLLAHGANPEAVSTDNATPRMALMQRIDGIQQQIGQVADVNVRALLQNIVLDQQDALAVLEGREPAPRTDTRVASSGPEQAPTVGAGTIPSVIADNSGAFLSPYTSDGVTADWIDMAINAQMGEALGSAAGAAAGAYVANKALENMPFGGMLGGMLGSKVGKGMGRDAAITASGGWEHIRATSDQSFHSLEDMARYLVSQHGTSRNFSEVVAAADKIYPGLRAAVLQASR